MNVIPLHLSLKWPVGKPQTGVDNIWRSNRMPFISAPFFCRKQGYDETIFTFLIFPRINNVHINNDGLRTLNI